MCVRIYLVRKQNTYIILIERSDDDLVGKPRDLAFNYKPSIQLHPLSSPRVHNLIQHACFCDAAGQGCLSSEKTALTPTHFCAQQDVGLFCERERERGMSALSALTSVDYRRAPFSCT
jgi:hypothetical protein